MRKIIVVVGAVFLASGALLLSLSPDVLSLLIVGLMCLIIVIGFVLGVVPPLLYGAGFRTARQNIDRITDVSAATPWLALQQTEYFFHQGTLDRFFNEYRNKVNQQQAQELICSDIEEVINEDSLALRAWQTLILQIPGTLTALGILGTFIGLVTGISNIGYSSVEATLSSIDILLKGIHTAFYTSIAGVILSIIFNLLYKMIWNAMLRELGLFTEDFHMFILPSVAEQTRQAQHEQMKQIMSRLDRIPKKRPFSLGMAAGQNGYISGDEQRLMPEIQEGLKNGEFIFQIQPRCDLGTRAITGGEVLIRWNHGEMGMVSPAAFMPIVENNGFIVKLDRYIWEEACKTIRRWIDSGFHPMPLSVNISRTDILAMDVAGFFSEMIRKYRIPPRYLDIEISETAYLQNYAAVEELEGILRQNGFRVIVDGFNGDYAVLNSLRNVNADGVKMDLRFVEDSILRDSEALMEIFEQIKKLRIPAFVTGIDNAEEVTVLRKAGCTEGQGFYLHRPMDVDEFEHIMEHNG